MRPDGKGYCPGQEPISQRLQSALGRGCPLPSTVGSRQQPPSMPGIWFAQQWPDRLGHSFRALGFEYLPKVARDPARVGNIQIGQGRAEPLTNPHRSAMSGVQPVTGKRDMGKVRLAVHERPRGKDGPQRFVIAGSAVLLDELLKDVASLVLAARFGAEAMKRANAQADRLEPVQVSGGQRPR